jgi:hypothetical protein
MAPDALLSIDEFADDALGVASTPLIVSSAIRRLLGMGDRTSRGVVALTGDSTSAVLALTVRLAMSMTGRGGSASRAVCSGKGDTLRGPPGRRSLDTDDDREGRNGKGERGRSPEGEVERGVGVTER